MTNLVAFLGAITNVAMVCSNVAVTSLSEVRVDRVLVTNWTGHVQNGRELGAVCTNHILTVVYEQETNVFNLKCVSADWHVWRPVAPITNTWGSYVLTNYGPWVIPSPPSTLWITNETHSYLTNVSVGRWPTSVQNAEAKP
jgi:hypothetical protein